jgi:RHS repeat-associated protein
MATTRFVWDYANDSYLMEKDETGATTAVYTNEPVQYGYLVSQRRDNATNYYHFDGQLSTRQLTDASQGISDSYAFSACGTAIARTGTTVNPFAYIGALGYFANPMQVYVRRRVYDAVTARWLSKDPSPHNGSSNALAYADNNPIMRTDPSGLRWRRRCWRWRPRCRPRRWRCENISDSETPTPVPTIEMPSTERCPQLDPNHPTWYGCFCGADNGTANRPHGTPPIDDVDECCHRHDIKYGDHNCPQFNPFRPQPPECTQADKELCQCLGRATCGRYTSGSEEYETCYKYRNAAMAAFLCDTRFGVPIPPALEEQAAFAREE